MVRIRLRRVGLKNQPSYRVVVADIESPRDGRFLEIVGNYNPRTEPFTFEVKEDRIYHWLSNGAQPSESVTQLFKSVGLLERFARYKAGEPIETLLAEAKTYFANRTVNNKTRREPVAKAAAKTVAKAA
jgi:small subunit ribosomal protein S16